MEENKNNVKNKEAILTDVRYICKTNPLMAESLQSGCDVAQLSNGDIIITQVKTVNTHYTWDSNKGKMVRINHI